MRLFSLFLWHRQIKFGERCPFGVCGRVFGRAQEEPGGQTTHGSEVVPDPTARRQTCLSSAGQPPRSDAFPQGGAEFTGAPSSQGACAVSRGPALQPGGIADSRKPQHQLHFCIYSHICRDVGT